jgi:hypothetical protein
MGLGSHGPWYAKQSIFSKYILFLKYVFIIQNKSLKRQHNHFSPDFLALDKFIPRLHRYLTTVWE